MRSWSSSSPRQLTTVVMGPGSRPGRPILRKLTAELLIARFEQPLRDKLTQRRRVVKRQRHRERRDQLRRWRKLALYPQPRQILFRRHQRQRVTFGFRDQAFDLARCKRVVVGESALSGNLDPASPQRVEKAGGIADAGKGQHALAAQRGDRR